MERSFVFTVSIKSQRGQEGLVAMPTAEAGSLRETPSIQCFRETGISTSVSHSVRGQGYIPSQRVRLGRLPAIRDPL